VIAKGVIPFGEIFEIGVDSAVAEGGGGGTLISFVEEGRLRSVIEDEL